jgi:hypothetical protein
MWWVSGTVGVCRRHCDGRCIRLVASNSGHVDRQRNRVPLEQIHPIPDRSRLAPQRIEFGIDRINRHHDGRPSRHSIGHAPLGAVQHAVAVRTHALEPGAVPCLIRPGEDQQGSNCLVKVSGGDGVAARPARANCASVNISAGALHFCAIREELAKNSAARLIVQTGLPAIDDALAECPHPGEAR